jgi:ketosteroid isomerase-like protein
MRIQACTKRAPLRFALPFALLLAACGPGDPTADRGSGDPAAPAGSAGALPAPDRAVAAARRDPARDEAELIRLERDYARALIGKDRAFLMRFYASDWRGGNWMGFWSKATMIKSILNARYVVKSMNVRDLKVRVTGDVAIVQGVDEEVTSVDGKDTSGKWAFTDVFERRDGRWVAVASHTSEVKPTGE